MRESSLKRLLTIFLCLCQRLFVRQSTTYKSVKTPTSNLPLSYERIHEPVREEQPAENAQRLRPDPAMSESTRPNDDESSTSKTQSPSVKVPRRLDNLRQKVAPLFDDYFSRVPPEHTTFYAVTVTLHDFKYFKSSARIVNRQIAKDECARVAQRLHHRMCQIFVRKNDYNNASTRHLVPHAIFVVEHSAKMSSHLHAIFSAHPDIVPKFDELLHNDKLKDFAPDQIHSSNVQHAYDVTTWKNYMTKDIRSPDDVLPTIRPYHY
jgi:hypothetical protein